MLENLYILVDNATGTDYPRRARTEVMNAAIELLGINAEADQLAQSLAEAFSSRNQNMTAKSWKDSAKFSLLYAIKIYLLAQEGNYWGVAHDKQIGEEVKEALVAKSYPTNQHLNAANMRALDRSEVGSLSLSQLLAVGLTEWINRYHKSNNGIFDDDWELNNAHLARAFFVAARDLSLEAAKFDIYKKDTDSVEFIIGLRIMQGLYSESYGGTVNMFQEKDLYIQGKKVSIQGGGILEHWHPTDKDDFLSKYSTFKDAILAFTKDNSRFSFLLDNFICESSLNVSHRPMIMKHGYE